MRGVVRRSEENSQEGQHEERECGSDSITDGSKELALSAKYLALRPDFGSLCIDAGKKHLFTQAEYFFVCFIPMSIICDEGVTLLVCHPHQFVRIWLWDLPCP